MHKKIFIVFFMIFFNLSFLVFSLEKVEASGSCRISYIALVGNEKKEIAQITESEQACQILASQYNQSTYKYINVAKEATNSPETDTTAKKTTTSPGTLSETATASNSSTPSASGVVSSAAPSGPITFENPISSSSVSGLLAQVLSALRSLIIVLAVVFIVIGGIMYMVSAGNSGMTERAKKIITAALIGLVIALSANTFLVEIWNILRPADISKPAGLALYDIAINVLNLLVSLVWVLSIISMVVGGMFMLTAYGNTERATKGKTILTYSILGVVISLSALIIVGQIQQLIRGY